MNETQKLLANKVNRLTQRLELQITDQSRSVAENARATVRYTQVCKALEGLVPYPTFSTEERVERLAHAVEGATPNMQIMEPDIIKLERVAARIDELVPDPKLSIEEKIARLGQQFATVFPEKVNKAG